MAEYSIETEIRPAQPGPAAASEDIVENTEPRDYWGLAYDGLGEDVKELVSSLKRRFDKKTDEAIKRLQKATKNTKIQRELRVIKVNYRRLDVNTKGGLQRRSLKLKKEIDAETIQSISTIHQRCMDNGDHDEREEDSTSVDELLQLCREGQEIAKAKEWELKFLNKTIIVAEQWGKLIDKVDRLRPAIDVPMSSQSAASTVWSVVKVLLQFAVQGEKELGAALSGITAAVEAMQTFTAFDRQLQEIRRSNEAEENAHIEVFELCLILAYRRILKFFAEAAELSAKSRAGVYWHAFWSAGGIEGFEKDILELKMRLFQDSKTQKLINNAALARQTLGLLEVLRGDLGNAARWGDDARHRLEQLMQSISDQIKERKRLEEIHDLAASRENTLGWWSGSKAEDHHAESKRHRVAETGDWLFKTSEYSDWRKAHGSRLLWIKGIPGAGKTVLMSRFIDLYLASRHDPDADVFQLAYFYCKRDDPNRRFSHNIFSSFIRQLADAYNPLPERLRQVSEAKSRPSSLSARVTDGEYRELLQELVPRTTETIFMLDALDECIGDERQSTDSNEEIANVLDMFEGLLRSGLPVKIVVASRYDKNIAARCRDKEVIELSDDSSQGDILKMVRGRIEKYNEDIDRANDGARNPQTSGIKPRLKRKVDKELESQMMEVFTQKSQGKFQWASMHIQYLLGGDVVGPGEMKRELGRMPRDLTESYREFLKRVRGQADRKVAIATGVFHWLLAFKGSCDQTPLIAATCQWLEDEPDPVDGDEDDILTACQNLVVADGSVFRFSHLSVQEYFEEHERDLVEDCYYDVVRVCTFMVFRYNIRDQAVRRWTESRNHEEGLSAVDDSIDQLYELWEFAVHHWHVHFRDMKEEQRRWIREIWLQEDAAGDDTSSMDWKIWQNLRAVEIMDTWRTLLRNNGTLELTSMTLLPLKPSDTTWRFPNTLVVRQAIGVGLLWKSRHLLRDLEADTRFSSNLHMYPISEEEGEKTKSGLWEESYPRLERHRPLEQRWRKELDRYSTDNAPTPRSERGRTIHSRRLIVLSLDSRWRDSVDYFAGTTQIIPPGSQSVTRTSLWGPALNDRMDRYSLLGGEWPVTFEKQRSALSPAAESLPVNDPADIREVRTLLRMLTYLEQGKSDDNVPELGPLSSIFADMIGDPSNFEFLEELARLTLVMICARRSYGGLRARFKREDDHINLLLRTFPNAPRTRYRHLCPAVDFLDWSSVLLKTVAGGFFRTEMLELLISHGADVNFVSEVGDLTTALIAACARGCEAMIKELLRKGARVNESPRTGGYASALFAAADTGSVRVVRLLMKNGAREVPRAARGGWRREVGGREVETLRFLMRASMRRSYELAELMILALVRGSRDEQEDARRWYPCGEGATNEGIPDGSRSVPSENHPTEADVDPAHDSAPEPQDANDPAEAIPAMITGLCQRMPSDPLGTRQALITAFGFSNYKDHAALGKGFENLVEKTARRDWPTIRPAWCEFLDLAEEAADEPNYLLGCRLAEADVKSVRRMPTDDFEMGPYSDAVDSDAEGSDEDYD